ncbi:agmatinase [Proteocatella sphenisci]|uniref:agmatinase n=1 Tax=Proteocatella sphenisci TaxID=181070 RepID=UPI00048BB7B8|nr:agmatinase [Proteocatella sphenisci]
MRKTDEMIKNETLWGGLCSGMSSEEKEKEADIVVFGIPFDGNVSYREGAKDAPAAIRESTIPIPATTEYFEDMSGNKVVDIGDFNSEDFETVYLDVEKKVSELVKNRKFFTMIGGDHSVTIPVLSGINKAIDHEFGVIHIDAHFDLCDELGGSKLSHGCTERRAIEMDNVGKSENIFFIGIRSVEPDELIYIRENKVNVINAAEYERLGTEKVIESVKEKMSHLKSIYLTVDIDCLDPAYSAGTGTPKFGGLTSRQLLDLLRGLFDLPIIGFDVVEVAPSLDASMTSVYAGQRIITECWGHHLRKTKGLK